MEAAYQAIDLLFCEIGENHDLWAQEIVKWKFAVLRRFNNAEERHQQLVRLVKSVDSESVRSVMLRDVRDDLENREYCMSLRKYSRSWDGEDTVALSFLVGSLLFGADRQRVLENRKRMMPSKVRFDEEEEAEKVRSFMMALQFLVENDPNGARLFVDGLCRSPLSFRNNPHPAYPLVLISSAFYFPDDWDQIWAVFEAYPIDVLRRTFDFLVPAVDRDYFRDGWIERLEGRMICQLYILLDRVFPTMPERLIRNGFMTVPMHRQEFEEKIRRRLIDLGGAGQIEMLIERVSCENRKEILRWCLRDARRRFDQLRWNTPEPKEISAWVRDGSSIFVRNSDDLKAAILVSLHRYSDLFGLDTPVARRCWDKQKGGLFVPIGEEDLSFEIGNYLASELKQVVVTREEELRVLIRKNRTDIVIHAVVNGQTIRVIIEHKRAHNTSSNDPVDKAMETQLAKRYLKASGCDYGIYLVSWFDGFGKLDPSVTVKNGLNAHTPSEALEILEEQAASLNREYGLKISTFLLNCSLCDP